MKIHRILCFGRNGESGNAAAVVEDAGLPEPERLSFAQRQPVSATVFVDIDANGALVLDYYYPHTRSPLCLHATLAASAVYFEQHSQARTVRFVTSMRQQLLEVERSEPHILVGLRQQPCPPWKVDLAVVAQLLCMPAAAVAGLPVLASVGSPKLLVEVTDQSVLHAMRPDLPALVSWSRQHGISGMYAYCKLGADRYAGRNFNHLQAHLEDAATGVAAGALALTLRQSLTLQQGDQLGQPCTLLARYQDGAVQIGGLAVRPAS